MQVVSIARWAAILTVFLAVILAVPNRSDAGDRTPSEYHLKAAFLLNFAKFITWPVSPKEDSGLPVVIVILGSDPFGSALDDLVADQRVRGRRLKIRRSSDVDTIPPCQILFICASEKKRMKDILGQVDPMGVLTVSEVEGFASMGGMINFTVENQRIRFEINQSAAERASLKVSSKLLRLASPVDPPREGRGS